MASFLGFSSGLRAFCTQQTIYTHAFEVLCKKGKLVKRQHQSSIASDILHTCRGHA